MKLAEWVRDQPETVDQIAARLGIQRVALHRIMRGAVMPRPATVEAIAAETGGAVTAADHHKAYQDHRATAA